MTSPKPNQKDKGKKISTMSSFKNLVERLLNNNHCEIIDIDI